MAVGVVMKGHHKILICCNKGSHKSFTNHQGHQNVFTNSCQGCQSPRKGCQMCQKWTSLVINLSNQKLLLGKVGCLADKIQVTSHNCVWTIDWTLNHYGRNVLFLHLIVMFTQKFLDNECQIVCLGFSQIT